jgi:hypothetical protein
MQLSLPSSSPVWKIFHFPRNGRSNLAQYNIEGRYDRQRFFGAYPNSNRIDGKTPNPFFY